METQATIKGFHSIDAIRYEEFNDRILEEFERIVQSFYEQPLVEAMRSFYKDLVAHLEHKNPHDLDIRLWSEVLINDLYKAYLRTGHSGTVTDMMSAIVKLIEVGSEIDVKAGYNTEKAINVNGWRALFEAHQKDRWAHEELFNRIQPGPFLLRTPSFSFNTLFAENFDPFKEDGYTFSCWNTHGGTLAFELSHDISEANNTLLPVFKLRFLDFDLEFLYEFNVGNLIGQRKSRDSSEESTTVVAMPLLNLSAGIDKFILCYENNQYFLRSQMATESIEAFIFEHPPVSFHLDVPIQARGNAIRNFTYYAACASGKEQVQLLA